MSFENTGAEGKKHTLGFGAFREIWDSVEDGGIRELTVTGTSMTPLLLDSVSRVYIEKCAGDAVEKGDIVFFSRSDGGLVLHRVVRVQEGSRLTVNGDAQTWSETIDRGQVLARVVKIRRKKRTFSVRNLFYRAYRSLWMLAMPIRPRLLSLYRLPARIKRKLGKLAEAKK